jgi:hypothetical protein
MQVPLGGDDAGAPISICGRRRDQAESEEAGGHERQTPGGGGVNQGRTDHAVPIRFCTLICTGASFDVRVSCAVALFSHMLKAADTTTFLALAGLAQR